MPVFICREFILLEILVKVISMPVAVEYNQYELCKRQSKLEYDIWDMPMLERAFDLDCNLQAIHFRIVAICQGKSEVDVDDFPAIGLA